MKNQNEDYGNNDSVSDMNNHKMGMDDIDTQKSNESAFGNQQPWNIEVVLHQQCRLHNTVIAKNANFNDGNYKILYAFLSSFEFHQNFTDDEFFMIKLCHIYDKANVPHHIVDDVIELLRECQINNMKIQPEKLVKCANFLNHLEKWFYSPFAQSVVVGLEGFSSNDILYSRSYRDSSEIIWYNFKEQAMDLINDVNIWGNLDNFQGIIDPKNPFPG